jgi:hypothetical protein
MEVFSVYRSVDSIRLSNKQLKVFSLSDPIREKNGRIILFIKGYRSDYSIRLPNKQPKVFSLSDPIKEKNGSIYGLPNKCDIIFRWFRNKC